MAANFSLAPLHSRFIGCQIVGQVILGRFRRRGQPLHVCHHFGHKGAFCRFALLNFVDVHFHQGVKFQRGQQVAIHGFQRGKGFLRVEGVIYQFADGAAFQIRADLNGMLLVLGGGVARSICVRSEKSASVMSNSFLR